MEWLKAFLDRIFAFIPRIKLVEPNEAGIRLTLGSYIRTVTPGWYIYWPLIQTVEAIIVVPQLVDLRPQSVWTKDGQNVVISGAIMFRVSDATKAMLTVHDFDQSVQKLALGLIRQFTGNRTLEECHDQDVLISEITKGIRDKANDWGLKIMSVYLTDMGTVKNIRVLTNESTVTPIPIEEKVA